MITIGQIYHLDVFMLINYVVVAMVIIICMFTLSRYLIQFTTMHLKIQLGMRKCGEVIIVLTHLNILATPFCVPVGMTYQIITNFQQKHT